MVLANPATLLFKDLPRSRCFNHNPTTMHFICLVKSLHGLIIIRSEFRKKYLTFHHVSPKNLVFFIWASFIIALVSLLRSCALVFALRPLGFCQELDARSYCDHSFKLDFPLCRLPTCTSQGVYCSLKCLQGFKWFPAFSLCWDQTHAWPLPHAT